MPQAAVLLAVLLAVLTAGCGNNAAAPEMTDRGNKKNQSDAEVTSVPEKAGNRKPELKDIGGEEIISTRQEIPAEPAAKERNEDKLLPDKEEKPAEDSPGDEENAGNRETAAENVQDADREEAGNGPCPEGDRQDSVKSAALQVEEQTIIVPGLVGAYRYMFL